MCQAKIILGNEDGGDVILEDVIHLRVEENTIWCARFFEDLAAVKGTIKDIDFLKHEVHITAATGSERQTHDQS